MRMLRLSGLDADDMTDDQRDAFVNMARNLGIEPGDAEISWIFTWRKSKNDRAGSVETCHCRGSKAPSLPPMARLAPILCTPKIPTPIDVAAERAKFPNFTSSIGTDLLLVPSRRFSDGQRGAGRCA
jgi:hypothetical protein